MRSRIVRQRAAVDDRDRDGSALAAGAGFRPGRHRPRTETQDPATGSIEAASRRAGRRQSVVVTGSRIRRSATDTVAPVIAVDPQSLTDRGFVSASQVLNQMTSNVPALALSPANGASSGPGPAIPQSVRPRPGPHADPGQRPPLRDDQQRPRRCPGRHQRDPAGLIERIEIVQAGGAVVYGSDAIAGVVNYILRDDFEASSSTPRAASHQRGDYPVYSLRGTVGHEFRRRPRQYRRSTSNGRATASARVQRPRRCPNLSRITQTNPADTGPNDGIPSVREILDARFYAFNVQGRHLHHPGAGAAAAVRQPALLRARQRRAAAVQQQRQRRPYNSGTFIGVPFAAGRRGLPVRRPLEPARRHRAHLGQLDRPLRIQRQCQAVGEFLYSRVEGTERCRSIRSTILNNAASGAGSIVFTRTNPFLTPQAIATLSQASPRFAPARRCSCRRSSTTCCQDNNPTTVDRNLARPARPRRRLQISATANFYWSVSGSYAAGRRQQSARSG